ncbi:MAG: helix-turn-helix transcriptional regulator [Nitrospiraceae bacterium]|nr:helix-turn-helix transcriptional regulator [Nitrospiraceae bacterium]
MFKSGKSIGELIRQMRKSSGLSQVQLAEKVGISYQQVQKYEKGTNQLSLSRLEQISEALGVPASVFMEVCPLVSAGQKDMGRSGLLNDEARLLMLYRRLHSGKLKHGLIEMLEAVVSISSGGKD